MSVQPPGIGEGQRQMDKSFREALDARSGPPAPTLTAHDRAELMRESAKRHAALAAQARKLAEESKRQLFHQDAYQESRETAAVYAGLAAQCLQMTAEWLAKDADRIEERAE